MKVLFVSSGNNKFGISPIVFNQGESLKKQGILIDYFAIKGKGIDGYVRNVPLLKSYLQQKVYDLIHSHYGLCGFVSILSDRSIPKVLSLMGSDAYGEYNSQGRVFLRSYPTVMTTVISVLRSKHVIVKSENIRRVIPFKKAISIIPNGVDIYRFLPMEREEALSKLKLDLNGKYVLLLGDKSDPRKNYKLASEAMNLISNKSTLIAPYPVDNELIPFYLNACDVLLLTSTMEGSPNVIKEAMSCNCPIVSTNVGDVKWLFGEEPGHFITTFDPPDVAEKIMAALDFSKKFGRTNGRKRIIELGLDSDTVAKKIINVYKDVLNKSA